MRQALHVSKVAPFFIQLDDPRDSRWSEWQLKSYIDARHPRRFARAFRPQPCYLGPRRVRSSENGSGLTRLQPPLQLTSNTLNRKIGAVEALHKTLGSRCEVTFDECSEHTPSSSVFAAAHAVRATLPDLKVTFVWWRYSH